MFVIEYLDAIITSYGSFETEAKARAWVDLNAPEDEQGAYEVIEIPNNPSLQLRVEPSDARTAPGKVYARRGPRPKRR